MFISYKTLTFLLPSLPKKYVFENVITLLPIEMYVLKRCTSRFKKLCQLNLLYTLETLF